MKALRIPAWGMEPAPEEVPEPTPGEGEVLVRAEACGVGLTVLNCIRGDLGADPRDLPRVPGHELVGRIEDVGPGVDGARRGERVAAYFYLFCGRCRHCLGGRQNLCDALAGFVGVNRDGGYAELAVLPERNAVRLPDGLDPVLATVVPDAVATPVHVAHLARIRAGERVAVVAAGGGVGVHMVQVARLFGAEAVGLEAAAPKRRHLETELGIPSFDSTDFGAVQLPPTWGARADVVVDLLGRPASLHWALATLDTGGRLITLTTFPGVEVPLDPRRLVFGEGSVLGSRYATRSELDEAARLVAAGRVRPVIGRREPVAGVAAIHEDLRAGRLLGRGALVWSSGS